MMSSLIFRQLNIFSEGQLLRSFNDKWNQSKVSRYDMSCAQYFDLIRKQDYLDFLFTFKNRVTRISRLRQTAKLVLAKLNAKCKTFILDGRIEEDQNTQHFGAGWKPAFNNGRQHGSRP